MRPEHQRFVATSVSIYIRNSILRKSSMPREIQVIAEDSIAKEIIKVLCIQFQFKVVQDACQGCFLWIFWILFVYNRMMMIWIRSHQIWRINHPITKCLWEFIIILSVHSWLICLAKNTRTRISRAHNSVCC